MRYTTLSMPRTEVVALVELVVEAYVSGDLSDVENRAILRLRLALEGKDLRATNRHNTHTRHLPHSTPLAAAEAATWEAAAKVAEKVARENHPASDMNATVAHIVAELRARASQQEGAR